MLEILGYVLLYVCMTTLFFIILLPVCLLLKVYFNKVMEWFEDRWLL